MYCNRLKGGLGGFILTAALILGIFAVSGVTAQAQWPYGYPQERQDRDRDRDYDRDRGRDRDRDYDGDRDRDRDDRYRRGDRYGRYGYGYRYAEERGYQDGLYTGERDARDGQSYDPQRSHYYRNATDGYNSSYGHKSDYKRAYRDGFLRGYDDGFRRDGGRYNRRGNYGRWFPFPFPF